MKFWLKIQRLNFDQKYRILKNICILFLTTLKMATWMPKHVEDHYAIEVHPGNQSYFFLSFNNTRVCVWCCRGLLSALTSFAFTGIKCLQFFFLLSHQHFIDIFCAKRFRLTFQVLLKWTWRSRVSDVNGEHKGPFTSSKTEIFKGPYLIDYIVQQKAFSY